MIATRKYHDWFGDGDLAEDVEEQIKIHGKPNCIFTETNGYMASLVYDNKVIVCGYDGGEYCHTFICDEPADSVQIQTREEAQ